MSRSREKTGSTIADELVALERSLLEPAVRGDAVCVMDMLADDFFEFGSSGRVWTREAVISELAAEAAQPQPGLAVSDMKVRQLSDSVALVNYRVAHRSGARRRTLRSSRWKRADGAWHMVFHQGTIVPDQVTA